MKTKYLRDKDGREVGVGDTIEFCVQGSPGTRSVVKALRPKAGQFVVVLCGYYISQEAATLVKMGDK